MKTIERLHLEAIEESKNWIEGLDGNYWGVEDKIAASKSAEITENIAIEFGDYLNQYYKPWRIGQWIPTHTIFDFPDKKSSKEIFQEFLKYKEENGK